METLLKAYMTSWYKMKGPFKLLYCDGEAALNCPEAIAELKRLNTEFRPKAPGQHASIVEARNAVLRHTLHMIEERKTSNATT